MIVRITAGVLALSCGHAAAARAALPQSDLEQAAQRAAAGGFSGVIAASKDGRVAFERSMGYADRERRIRHRADQSWPWASVTKQVTAALIMREVDRGTLGLDQPIRALMPDFTGATADRLTVRHLLQHVSGLPNPNAGPAEASGMPSFYLQRAATPAFARNVRATCGAAPVAEPGSAFSYNNCDYYLLQAILERLTKRSYAALVRGTGIDGLRSARLAPDRPAYGLGHIVGYAAGGERAPQVNFAAYGAGGGLTGTARDLLSFDDALLTGALVSPRSTAEMWKGEPKFGYAALGAWSFTAPLKGCTAPVALIERRGAISGIQVRNLIAPQLNRALVAFTNDAGIEFGEIWQGRGLSFDLASAGFCSDLPAASKR